MTENRNRVKKYSISVFLGAMLFCMCMNLTGSVLNEIMIDYGIGLDNGGLMTFFQYIGGIIAICVLLIFADYMKKPRFLMIGFAVAGIMLSIIGSFLPFALFILSYFVFGAALGTIDTLNNAVLSDIHPRNMNEILCILHGMCGLGAAIIPIITVVIGTANWKGIYRLVGIVAIIIFFLQLIMYLIEKKNVDSFYSKTSTASIKESAKEFFMDKDVWFAIFSIFFYGLSQGGVTTWIVKFSRDIFPEAGPFLWAICLSAYWIGATVSRLSIGINTFLKKMNARRVIIIGGILSGLALMVSMIPGNYVCLFVGILLYGALSGTTLPQAVALITGWYAKNTGLCSSISYIAFYGGLAVSTMTMGMIAATFGMYTMMVFPVVTVIMSGLIAMPISKNIKKRGANAVYRN